MSSPLKPYRRAPGTIDPGADFARQLQPSRMPPFGELIEEVSVPGDGLQHYLRHHLGRPFKLALIGGYTIFRAGVFTDSPAQVRAAGFDPARYFGVFGLSASGDNVVTFWVI